MSITLMAIPESRLVFLKIKNSNNPIKREFVTTQGIKQNYRWKFLVSYDIFKNHCHISINLYKT